MQARVNLREYVQLRTYRLLPMNPYLQPGFFDVETRTAKLTEMGDPLVGLNARIDWEAFRSDLNRVHNKARRNNAGARPHDVILMFKILVLQQLHNLSDERIEYQIRDRLSFMRFLGLQLESKVPDAKTVWLFREHLKELNLMEALFNRFHEQLAQRGYVAKAGQMIDATFVEAPKQRNTREENALIKENAIPIEWGQDDKTRRYKLAQKDTDAAVHDTCAMEYFWTQRRMQTGPNAPSMPTVRTTQ